MIPNMQCQQQKQGSKGRNNIAAKLYSTHHSVIMNTTKFLRTLPTGIRTTFLTSHIVTSYHYAKD